MSDYHSNKIASINDAMKSAVMLATNTTRHINNQPVAKDSRFVGKVYARHDQEIIAIVLENEQQIYIFRLCREDFQPENLPTVRTALLEFQQSEYLSVPKITVNLFGGIKNYLDMLYELSDGNTEKSYITNDIIG